MQDEDTLVQYKISPSTLEEGRRLRGAGREKIGERTTEGFVRRKRRRVILTHRHRVKDTVTLTGHFHTCCLQMLND